MEFGRPLLCVKAAGHEGRLGANFGLLALSSRNVVLSSLQCVRDGCLSVRLFEATGRATSAVTLTAAAPILEATATNLMDDPLGALTPAGTRVSFDLRPFEIKTLRLRLAPLAPSSR
jgi:alpha-mannosidase